MVDQAIAGIRRPHSEFLTCHKWLRKKFKQTTDHRDDHPGDSWIEHERIELATHANQWARTHRIDLTVTRDDIERVEVCAVGHIDYASKLCLHVAELIYGRRPA